MMLAMAKDLKLVIVKIKKAAYRKPVAACKKNNK